jgi:hypothetical protein
MLIVEHIKLKQMQTLINTAGVKLELYEHESGNFVLASTLKHPQGTAYFLTTDALLGRFVAGVITLQQLFDLTPSVFIEVVIKEETRLYLKNDIDIFVRFGDKTYNWFLEYNTL